MLAYQGDSVVLVTATVSKEVRKGIDFLPLVVDYQEMSYAAGASRADSSNAKAGPAIRRSRTARFHRPAHPTALPRRFLQRAADHRQRLIGRSESSPDVKAVAINGCIGGPACSRYPSPVPSAGQDRTRDGNFIIDPTHVQLAQSDLELVVVGTREAIDGGGRGQGTPENTVLEAILRVHGRIREIIEAQEELRAKVGKPKPRLHRHRKTRRCMPRSRPWLVTGSARP